MRTEQTAVEWLIEKLNQCEPMYSGIQSDENKAYIDNLIEQAKQMEKEQLQNLIKWMYKVSSEEPMRFETDIDDIVEQFINETYGN